MVSLSKYRPGGCVARLSARLDSSYGITGPMTFDFKRLFIWGSSPFD
jgi:hypothetical protein